MLSYFFFQNEEKQNEGNSEKSPTASNKSPATSNKTPAVSASLTQALGDNKSGITP